MILILKLHAQRINTLDYALENKEHSTFNISKEINLV